MFTLPGLVRRTIIYHWRGNIAVLLGVAVGSAILTGALLVGDSLRGSLRVRIERQLAGLDAAAMLPRPVRADIVDGLPGQPVPVLLLPGSIQVATPDNTLSPYLGRVSVLGIDERFEPVSVGEQTVKWNGTGKQIVLSERVATKLGTRVGDRITLGVERFSDLPRSSSLAKRGSSDVSATLELVVAAILPADSAGNDFNLTLNPSSSLNVFLPIRTLTSLVSGNTDPVANTLLSFGASTGELNSALRTRLNIDDYGLRIREITRKGYLSVESDLLILPPTTVSAIQIAAKELGLKSEPTVAYIADTISHGEKEIPYPVVAGLNANAAAPLGPFLPPGVTTLGDDEVVLLEWSGSPLNRMPKGAKLRMDYFDPEVEGEGQLKTTELTLRGYLQLEKAAQDRDLVPEIRGVTDPRANLYDWDRPPVLPKERIRARVPDKPPHPRGTFFNTNKATPMAYVNLVTGQKLFGSRYGSITSVRIAPDTNESLEQTAQNLRRSLLKHLDPETAGLVFQPVRDRLIAASRGGTDFGGLYLGFSSFLIGAALILVGLLFRLTLDRRAGEIGLLLALGFRVPVVRRLLLSEGAALAVVGAVTGLAVGLAYNRLLLGVLVELWPDKELANVLKPHATPASFVLGFTLTVLMALGALWLSVRGLVRISPPTLLRGETTFAAAGNTSRSRVSSWLAVICLLPGIGLIAAGQSISNPDYQAMSFFAGGGLLLVSGLILAWSWMKRSLPGAVNGRGLSALAHLGWRNAARNPVRSLLTMALLSSAAFLLVAVESFRRQPGTEFLDKNGGSGGFNLIGETDIPLFQSFGDKLGRGDLEKQLITLFGSNPDTQRDSRSIEAIEELNGIEVFPLRLRSGDDASCLNLYQATRPRVLGVPDTLIDRGGFKFYATEAQSDSGRGNPWNLLKKPVPGGAIPVFCEQNTAQWMLKTAVGGEIQMPADDGKDLTLRIVGTFADSPFQSELVMADADFAKAFPKTGGYRVFLIRTPPGKEDSVARLLSMAYRANGLILTPTRERVAAYQAVIGAYLSTFQLLGGLGLLLGVLGLAVVMLRGIWERIAELALLRAVGYRTSQIQFLVLAENALLLITGLAIGVVAALISVAPHVAEGAAVPWLRLACILGVVLIVGLGVASAATASILRVPVIPALRRE